MARVQDRTKDRTLTLRAVNGKLVAVETAGEDNVGLIHARTPPDSPGPWELIHEQTLGGGKVALYVLDDHQRRRYFSAQPDGSIVCNRVRPEDAAGVPEALTHAIGAFEECTKVVRDGGVGYRFHTGFLCCDLALPWEQGALSGHVLVANRAEMKGFETFEPTILEGGDVPAPSRAELLAVKADFCNLKDRHGRVMFTSTLASIPADDQDDWIARLKAAGNTHVFVSVTTGYGDFFPTIDFADGRLDELMAILWRLRRDGLIPVLFLTSGDRGSYDAERMRRICRAIVAANLTAHCVFVCAWESVRGGWTSAQFNEGNLIMRDQLGPDAVIAAHLSQGRAAFSSHAPVEPDDPFGGEIECWFQKAGGRRTCGPEFDIFLFQCPVAQEGEIHQELFEAQGVKQPAWEDAAIQIADRFLARGTSMPGAAGFKHLGRPDPETGKMPLMTHSGAAEGPDWFAGPPAGHLPRPPQRQRPVLVMAEVVAYVAIRDRATPAWIAHVANRSKSFGYQFFGNGQPTA